MTEQKFNLTLMYNTLNVTKVGGSSVAAGLNIWPAAPASERVRELEAGRVGGTDGGSHLTAERLTLKEGVQAPTSAQRGGAKPATQGGTVPSPGQVPVCTCSPSQAIKKLFQGMVSKQKMVFYIIATKFLYVLGCCPWDALWNNVSFCRWISLMRVDQRFMPRWNTHTESWCLEAPYLHQCSLHLQAFPRAPCREGPL